jgi:hypothetical protein
MLRSKVVGIGLEKRRDNRTPKGRFAKRRTVPINLTVTTRRQTAQEARVFAAAFDLLVNDIVSHELRHARR